MHGCVVFFFSSRRRHTRCALVTGVQTCALPIYGRLGYGFDPFDLDVQVVWSQKTVADNIATIEDTPILDYPASTIVNSTLGFRVNDNFRLQFSVRNLFDQAVPYEAQVTRQFGVYDPLGRTYKLRAAVNF